MCPYQGFSFFIFVTLFCSILYHTHILCLVHFYCIKERLKESKRLKGQVLAAEAGKDSASCTAEVRSGMMVSLEHLYSYHLIWL